MEDNDIRRSFAANLARLLSETGIKAAQRSSAARCAASEYPSRAWSRVDTRMYIATLIVSPPP